MNLNRLKYFEAVCTYGTVSDAAEVLHISQPSLSYAIKELESEFGIELFHRHHDGMRLTGAGEVLLGLSRDLLERVAQAEKTMKNMGRERKKLRLGVPPMIGSLILSAIYRDYVDTSSDNCIEVFEGGRTELAEMLSKGYVDMVFLPHRESVDSEFLSIPIGKLEIALCVSENSALADKKAITPSELAETPLVLFENGFFQTAEIKRWFAAKNATPNILMQTGQLSTMLGCISNGTAVGFVFTRLVENHSGIVSVPIKPGIEVNVSLVWKKGGYVFDGMKSFRDYVLTKKLI